MPDEVGDALRLLHAQVDRLEAEVRRLERVRLERDQLRDAIRLIEQSQRVTEDAVRSKPPERSAFAEAVVRQFTLVRPEPSSTQAALEVLAESGQPMHIREIVAAIHARGWHTERSYESLRGAVASFLDARSKAEDGEIEKPAPGTYRYVAATEKQLAVMGQ